MIGYESFCRFLFTLTEKALSAKATRCKLRMEREEKWRRRADFTQPMRLLGVDLVSGYFNQPASV